MKHTCIPVILAGGSGTRLWPLSRKQHPKQFLPLHSTQTLLQETVTRLQSLAHDGLLLVTHTRHYFMAEEQLDAIQHAPVTYLLEPCSRNTAPALALSALHLQQTQPDAVMLVMPADHYIPDAEALCTHLTRAADLAARDDVIVTFGMRPSTPHTGYGYIQSGAALYDAVYAVSAFHEKPDSTRAAYFLSQTHYWWNSGFFIMRPAVYLQALAQHAPEVLDTAEIAFGKAHHHQDFIRVPEDTYLACPDISIDYAVMEKTSNACVMPLDILWSDLGSWSSVATLYPTDVMGNAITGSVITHNTRDSFISSHDILVSTLGVDNLAIIATPDAVLVARKDNAEDMKTLVSHVAQQHASLTEDHRRVARPWGYYEVLSEGLAFKVKRIMVKPHAQLSLQQHAHRSEHWVVVEGTAQVINGDTESTLLPNQSTYIPARTKHRLANCSDDPLFIIEVQTGSYLGEDDIERFDDVYARERFL